MKLRPDPARRALSAGEGRSAPASAPQRAIERLGQGPLSAADQPWLSELNARIGVPERPLEVKALNADPQAQAMVRDSLRVVLAATRDRPKTMRLAKLTLPVHNRVIGARLRGSYSARDFRALFNLADRRGVFDLSADPKTGLIRTALVGADENQEMRRQWVTDTVRCGDFSRARLPEAWRRSMRTLLHFYSQPIERAAFERAIDEPDSYRSGPPSAGVAHVFDPHTLERDPGWANNKRLESIGLALSALIDTAIAGVRGEPWGFTASDLAAPELAEVIVHLSRYVQAIAYPSAPSAGTWEETQHAGGLTWDTEAIRAGLAKLDLLLADPAPQLRGLKQRLNALGAPSGESLSGLIRAGQAQVEERLSGEHPVENPARPIDASLAFISASSIHLSGDPMEDVDRQFALLAFLETKLVRKNGMIRYAPFEVRKSDGSKRLCPDSYLAKNYWIAFNPKGRLDLGWREEMERFGSKDASDVDLFAERAGLAVPDREAEWFMVSDMARGYGTQVEKLLDRAEQEGRAPSTEERRRITHGLRKETEFINRSYARITAADDPRTPASKSNGKDCPGFALPEAYECVSTFDPRRPERFIPGPDTPLAWAAASLFGASQQFLENLTRVAALS